MTWEDISLALKKTQKPRPSRAEIMQRHAHNSSHTTREAQIARMYEERAKIYGPSLQERLNSGTPYSIYVNGCWQPLVRGGLNGHP